MSEARRALFNRESVIEILVDPLILLDGSPTLPSTFAAETPGRQGAGAKTRGTGLVTPSGATDDVGVTLVGVVRTLRGHTFRSRWYTFIIKCCFVCLYSWSRHPERFSPASRHGLRGWATQRAERVVSCRAES